jgi:hypothetical protein
LITGRISLLLARQDSRMIAVGRDWEDFTRLNKLIDVPNPPAQHIRKVCKSVEDCLAANKWAAMLQLHCDLCLPPPLVEARMSSSSMARSIQVRC